MIGKILARRDIRSHPATGEVQYGALLELTFQVSQIGESFCIPLEGVAVDICHANALGMYSDAQDPGFDTSGYEFTSQLFFNENFTDIVHTQKPYASKGHRTLLNEGDGIYQQGGSQLLLDVKQGASEYTARFDVGFQMG